MAKNFSIYIFLVFLIIGSLCADNNDIVINEIMNDPSGNDGNREWVEIYNSGNSSVDLTGWRFWENDTNHTFSANMGDLIIEAGEYIVIADDPSVFLTDYPDYSGSLIDSNWVSLKNSSGEEIGLKDSSLTLIESFTYTVSLTDEGHSLEKKHPLLPCSESSSFAEGPENGTPGEINSTATNITLYVKTTGNDSNDGYSWTEAKQSIQAMLDIAWSGDTILVENGNYNITSEIDFGGKDIQLASDDGTHSTYEDATKNQSNCTIDAGNNSRVFYFHNSETSSAIIDGFTITGGNTDSGGGGIACYSSSPTITNCAISGNEANSGGGIYSDESSSPTITNCTISGNLANVEGGLGGGMAFVDSSATVSNAIISGNSGIYGGGIYCNNSSPVIITNSTISGNSGIGIYCLNSSSLTVKNTIFWGNSSSEIFTAGGSSIEVTYSDVEGGYTGTGNIDSDPQFVSPIDIPVQTTDGDFHLEDNSPCIGAATRDGATVTDIEGTTRGTDPNFPDIGAYENELHVPSLNSTITLSTRTESPKWHLISPPIISIDSNSAIFNDWGTFQQDWSIGRWDAVENGGQYEKVKGVAGGNVDESEDDFVPGTGWWIAKKDTGGGTFDFTISGSPVINNIAGDYTYEITLNEGWNMLGNPFNFNRAWDNTITIDGNALGTAQANALTDGKIYYYRVEAEGYPETSVDPINDSHVMGPWYAYWIKVENGAGNPVLGISSVKSSSSASSISSLPIAFDWQVDIIGMSESGNPSKITAGISERARVDADRLDDRVPPAPPVKQDLQIYFEHDNWSLWPGKYRRDIRPVSSSMIFPISVNAKKNCPKIFLKFKFSRVPNNYRVWLYDKANDKIICLKDRTILADSFEFVPDSENTAFELIVSNLPDGDMNGDREVSFSDAKTILKNLVGQTESNSVQRILGDVTGDGTISAYDAAIILQSIHDIDKHD